MVSKKVIACGQLTAERASISITRNDSRAAPEPHR